MLESHAVRDFANAGGLREPCEMREDVRGVDVFFSRLRRGLEFAKFFHRQWAGSKATDRLTEIEARGKRWLRAAHKIKARHRRLVGSTQLVMPASPITSSVKEFLRAADIDRSRSSITNQLQWTTAILIAGIAALQVDHSPSWLIIFLAILLALNVGVFLVAYLYLVRTRPYSLRSESFDHKMSELIERRTREIESGRYLQVSAVSELREQSGQIGGQTGNEGYGPHSD